jgi:sugar/nucleoside kinase (ribokinase family)
MIDYLAIGTVTEDLWPGGRATAGGTVMYASRCARQLVTDVTVLTAAAPDFDFDGVFPGIDVRRLPAQLSTQFWNTYDGGRRTQYTRWNGVRFTAELVKTHAPAARIVHLGPLCNEIDVDVVRALPPSQFLGVTPQGWLRRWDAEGRVRQDASNWTHAHEILTRADATVMSIEDINDNWDVARDWARFARLLVVTQGAEGCTVFHKGESIQVPAPEVTLVEPTGAGDIFGSTFFVALQRGDSPRQAAVFANCIASQSVTRPQLEGLPTPDDIARCAGD